MHEFAGPHSKVGAFSFLAEVLVVMDEVGQLSALVDHLAGRADRARQGAGAATEHADLAHLKEKSRFQEQVLLSLT